MKLDEIKNLTAVELSDSILKTREELFNFRIKKYTQQLSDLTKVRKERKTLARMLTIEKERQLAKSKNK
jgi:large subunit ribosomal protein L29